MADAGPGGPSGPSPEVVAVHGDRVELDVAAIAVVVRSCPLVVGLHSGRHGRIAMDGGGFRQVGLCVVGADLVVGVVGQPGATTAEVAAQVRSVLSAHAPGFQITVSVCDEGSLTSD